MSLLWRSTKIVSWLMLLFFPRYPLVEMPECPVRGSLHTNISPLSHVTTSCSLLPKPNPINLCPSPVSYFTTAITCLLVPDRGLKGWLGKEMRFYSALYS